MKAATFFLKFNLVKSTKKQKNVKWLCGGHLVRLTVILDVRLSLIVRLQTFTIKY
nr:MAG TPA: hypothetical protein [Caudoviricetes sp.]